MQLEFEDKVNIKPINIIQLIQKYPQIYRLQGQHRLNFSTNNSDTEMRVNFAKQLLNLLSN